MFAWYSSAMLVMESTSVIGLRLTKLTRGGSKAGDEANLRVAEKIAAPFEAVETLPRAEPHFNLAFAGAAARQRRSLTMDVISASSFPAVITSPTAFPSIALARGETCEIDPLAGSARCKQLLVLAGFGRCGFRIPRSIPCIRPKAMGGGRSARTRGPSGAFF